MTELMIPVTKVTSLVDRWVREVQGTDGGYHDAMQECIHDLTKLVGQGEPSLVEGVEQFRQQLLASDQTPPSSDTLIELVTMQECLSLLERIPIRTRYRVLKWLESKRAEEWDKALRAGERPAGEAGSE